MSPAEVVGLIAGNRSLPLMAAKAAKARGARLVVVGLAGETDRAVYELSDERLEVPLGALGPWPPSSFPMERALWPSLEG